jgi:hypothetical protein
MPFETKVAANGKQLFVACHEPEFARILQFICAEAKCSEVVEDVRMVMTTRRDLSASVPVSGKRDRIALLGCGIVAFVFLFVFVAGITQIISWFQK